MIAVYSEGEAEFVVSSFSPSRGFLQVNAGVGFTFTTFVNQLSQLISCELL